MKTMILHLTLLGLTLVPASFAAPMQVFLLVGQSNMAGRGALDSEARAPHPGIYTLSRQLLWVPATDPLHFDKPKLVGVGLGIAFAQAVAAAAPGSDIGLVPAAVGGTSLDEWRPGGPLYTNAVTRTRLALRRGKLAGILWHQGEADSAPDKASTYARRFAVFAAALRHDLEAPDVPLIVGETGRFRPDGAGINRVLAGLPAVIPHCAFVSAEGLTDKGDHLHFDTRSQRELGRRYAQAWLQAAAAPRGE